VFFIIEVLERRDQVICMTLHKQLQDLLRHSPNFNKKKKKTKGSACKSQAWSCFRCALFIIELFIKYKQSRSSHCIKLFKKS